VALYGSPVSPLAVRSAGRQAVAYPVQAAPTAGPVLRIGITVSAFEVRVRVDIGVTVALE
jgi:hypothetical protein